MPDTQRRGFLRAGAVVGGGLLVGFTLSGCGGDGPGPRIPYSRRAGALEANAFIQVLADSTVRFFLPRDEMGQGIYMGLATLVGEELGIDPRDIDVRFAGIDEAYAHPNLGMQVTGGSTSIRAHYRPVRQAAANVRALLLRAAARELQVDPGELTTENGQLVHGAERYPFGRFTAAAARSELAADAPLRDPAAFRYIGSDLPRNDALAKATGTAQYGIDIELPGMRRAVVSRSPVPGGRLRRFDATAAARMPGVEAVFAIDSGVAVVGRSFWEVSKAAEKLAVDWELPELAGRSMADIRRDYDAVLAEEDGDVAEERGELAALADDGRWLTRRFWVPYLSHATLEPMNAVARIADGRCEIWTGSQAPGAVHGIGRRYSGLAAEQVVVHNQFMGGGFGRRTMLGQVAEAVQCARETGHPVQVLWRREDEFRHGFHRPAALIELRAHLAGNGTVDGWAGRRVGANCMPNLLEELLPGLLPGAPDWATNAGVGLSHRALDGWFVDPASVEGLWEDYDWPNLEIRHSTVDHGVKIAYWRSVGHSFTAFAKEVMMDELAERAGVDPVRFRTDNLTGNPRLRAVVERAGTILRAGPGAAGRGVGIAAHASFGSYLAQVAEASRGADGSIRVHRVHCVVDCGTVINPAIVRDQMIGAIIFGLTAALHGRIDIDEGRVVQSNFHDYPILRANEVPEISVDIVDSSEAPGGVGEPGLPPIAPAVANALYAATGERVRELPLVTG